MDLSLLPPLIANAGTPLILFGLVHLLLVNAIIGVIEGRWIAQRTETRAPAWVLGMIAANYASAWAGMVLCGATLYLTARLLAPEFWIAGVGWATVLAPILVLAATFALESPIVVGVAWLKKARVGTSLRAFSVVQLWTHVPICVIYLLLSDFSAVGRLSWAPVRAGNLREVPGAWVYYLSADGRGVHRVRLDGSGDEIVTGLAERGIEPEAYRRFFPPLYAAPNDPMTSAREVDDTALRYLQSGRWEEHPIVVARLPGRVGLFETHPGEWGDRPAGEIESFHASYRPARVPVHALGGRDVSIYSDFNPSDRLQLGPGRTIAYQTLGLRWIWESATVVEDRYLVCGVRLWRSPFVVVIDLSTMRAAPLARGSSPVVVLEMPEPASAAP